MKNKMCPTVLKCMGREERHGSLYIKRVLLEEVGVGRSGGRGGMLRGKVIN